ncbi:MAG: OB-fold domain-containing protein [Proteobacteria bacterium]|nr:OB-fold domain-containing protein [Pseudomonadota bacterium]
MSNSDPGRKDIVDGWFKEVAGELRLMGVRCRDCQKTFFPAKMVCPECFDGELEAAPLSRTGILHTYALSFMGPASMKKPYLMGFIDLPEGIKLYSIITGLEPEPDSLKVGQEMEMVVEAFSRDEQGRDIYTYKFRPTGAKEGQSCAK